MAWTLRFTIALVSGTVLVLVCLATASVLLQRGRAPDGGPGGGPDGGPGGPGGAAADTGTQAVGGGGDASGKKAQSALDSPHRRPKSAPAPAPAPSALTAGEWEALDKSPATERRSVRFVRDAASLHAFTAGDGARLIIVGRSTCGFCLALARAVLDDKTDVHVGIVDVGVPDDGLKDTLLRVNRLVNDAGILNGFSGPVPFLALLRDGAVVQARTGMLAAHYTTWLQAALRDPQ